MPKLAEPNRDLWLWLCRDGGAWTVADLSKEMEIDSEKLFVQLNGLSRRKLVEQLPPVAPCHRLRYAVTGTCLVPLGMHVGEVQA